MLHLYELIILPKDLWNKTKNQIIILHFGLPFAIRNFGIKSTFQSRPRPVSDGGGGKLNLTKIHDGESDRIGFSFYDEENDLVGLTIEVDRGIEFSVDSNKLIVNQFEHTLWLLNKGFDLFELIDENLAISTIEYKSIW